MPESRLFGTILCPIDFSDHSRQALAYAAVLAARERARLIVIFVEDPFLAAAAAVAYDERTLIDKGRKELRRLVEKTVTPFGIPVEAVTLDVAVGTPHKLIEWTADRMKCDLIVMGAHGLTGANRMVLGSTTHRVLRRSPIPVLATPPAGPRLKRPSRNWPAGTVIAPIELGSRDRADALAASVVARELGVRLELVHVMEPIADVPWLELDEARRNQQRRRRAEGRLAKLQEGLTAEVTGVRVEAGDPAQKIAALAASAKVALVIMTRRPGQGLFGPRQGSISYQVLCKSNVPVLALPSDSRWVKRVVRRSS